ncbi:MAG TPA: hypothetical protein VM536_03290, partial [Chloroflexia bacterium]|nr:hypothetical protein [Chloroflexia bacterium]
MQQPLDQGPWADIEDLDPEPPARGMGRREWILGVLLLVSVLGLASWQWWDQQGKVTHYRAGQRAARAHEWDAALAAYRAAPGYLDA